MYHQLAKYLEPYIFCNYFNTFTQNNNLVRSNILYAV